MTGFNTDNRIPHSAAPDSLESVLNSLQTLLNHSRHYSEHTLLPTFPPAIREPFDNQPAEQYDDPLILEDIALPDDFSIPVLEDVIRVGHTSDTRKLTQPASAEAIENTLNELRAELGGMVADILIDAREHLEQQEESCQEVLETGLKRFLHDLLSRLPR